MRVFLDANVLFSAAYSEQSRTAFIVQLAQARYCTVMSSAFAVEEARRNLQLKHPNYLDALDALLGKLVVSAEPNPDQVAWAIEQGLAEKDAPILAAAVRAGADLLVTGDKTHFGRFFGKALGGVTILPPASALQVILELK